MDVSTTATATAVAAASSLVERTTDHTIRFETWVGYNSTRKHFHRRDSKLVSCKPAHSSLPKVDFGLSLLTLDGGNRRAGGIGR